VTPGDRFQLLARATERVAQSVSETRRARRARAVRSRRTVFDSWSAHPVVARYVADIRDNGYLLTDDDVAVLRTIGLSDDAILDITLEAVRSAALRRDRAARTVLER
jgi:hypothetical protein